uniref:AlNc14C269G9938 protein n=1 Tax=Albugo laibachii Nc14 TaxID=890382 RepID=F0WUB7_9STRA|nr:AlNc14C269G9938 [Albugo laibachii Nc14]|eukprot:CCA24995.1 AlNc14C269G9938 [Albugo laibachii Nc14]
MDVATYCSNTHCIASNAIRTRPDDTRRFKRDRFERAGFGICVRHNPSQLDIPCRLDLAHD